MGFFRWGREKYSKGRAVGGEKEGSGGKGGGKLGVGDPPVHPHRILPRHYYG